MTAEVTTTRAFLFTDVESSTRLWERDPVQMRAALARHDRILKGAVEQSGGAVVKTTGDGIMAVFDEVPAAFQAALDAQAGLATAPWETSTDVRVRMGIHWGAAQMRDEDYFGPTVNRTARIMAAGHGGQVLVSAAANAQVRQALPAGVELRDLGEHRLKDLAAPERIFQLGAAGLPSSFPALVTLDRVVNNLQSQTTPFIGRDSDVRQLRRLLDDPTVRLVSLTGPGGTGKTRLALQAAADQVDRYLDGVFFIDLSHDADADAGFSRIVRTVSVIRAPDEPPLEALKKELAGRHVLLLLDNCEQVRGLGPAVAQLLVACAHLTVLATSRGPLRVRGERAHPVPPMALPEPAATMQQALGSEAVRLFVDRAVAGQPSFVLDESTVADVVAICIRLDGLPLALELAAARLRVFAPAELRSRLGLSLLRGGPTDLPDRQRTLRATIDWSYALLEAGEQQLFVLLSVFADADVTAVEAVAQRCGLDARVDVIDGLDSLLAKGLMRELPGRQGHSRFGMLHTIREYAQERLANSSDREAFRRAHAEHFAELVEQVQQRLSSPSRAEELDRLEADLGNAQAAWRYFVACSDVDRLSSMLESLWVLHLGRGWYHGAVELANDLLGLLEQMPVTPERVRQQVDLQTSLARALMAIYGYTDQVELAFERALKLSIGAPAPSAAHRVAMLRSLARLHQMRMEFDACLEIGMELLALVDEQSDPVLAIDAHLVLGSTLAFLEGPEEGMVHLDAAIELFELSPMAPSGPSPGAHPGVVSLTTSALMLWILGRPDEAVERAGRADEASRRLGHPFTRAYALFHTAFLEFLKPKGAEMGRRADELRQLANANDYTIWRALAMLLQGMAQVLAGDGERGIAAMERALSLYRSTSAPPVFWPLVLQIRAAGLAAAGRPSEALPLVEEALRLTPQSSPFYGESALQYADVLLATDPSNAEAARDLYREAIESSQHSGTRGIELRAATRWLRVAREDERMEAVALLDAVLKTFTQGFEYGDLQSAAAELERARSSP